MNAAKHKAYYTSGGNGGRDAYWFAHCECGWHSHTPAFPKRKAVEHFRSHAHEAQQVATRREKRYVRLDCDAKDQS